MGTPFIFALKYGIIILYFQLGVKENSNKCTRKRKARPTIVYGTIRDIFREKGLVILEMNGEADHVHVLFEADPFTAPGSLVSIVKTKTSRFARKEYGETVLKKYYWKPYFWSDSYFVTTVSENSLAMVQDYIRNQ